MADETADQTDWSYWVFPQHRYLWRYRRTDLPQKWDAVGQRWVNDPEFLGWLLEATTVDQIDAARAAALFPAAVAPERDQTALDQPGP